MFDYKLIEALAMVVQECGFDKAAKVLNITQSAVSQRVKLLEEQVGQVLLARTTPPQPTPPGRRILMHHIQVRRLENDLQDEMETPANKRFATVAVGINNDSLATWFLAAMHPLLIKERVLLDIRVDDQGQTHQLLKNGEVVGCIGTQATPLQGCRVAYLGRMIYRLCATPDFADRWFPNGLTLKRVLDAPAIIFNRKDELHQKLLRQTLTEVPDALPAHYIPSSEKFAEGIAMGLGYGMLPRQQSDARVRSGTFVDLAPGHEVHVNLYWHCWNLKSRLLEKFTRQIVSNVNKSLQ